MNVRVEDWLGHKIRFVELRANEWWAVAMDVTKALGLSNTSLAVTGNAKRGSRGLQASEKTQWRVTTPHGKQKMLLISVVGIYRLIFKSSHENAIPFHNKLIEAIGSRGQLSELFQQG